MARSNVDSKDLMKNIKPSVALVETKSFITLSLKNDVCKDNANE